MQNLRLDSGRHWLRLDELNRFAWPGYDLRPIPSQPGRYDYGMLAPSLFRQLREGILTRQGHELGVSFPVMRSGVSFPVMRSKGHHLERVPNSLPSMRRRKVLPHEHRPAKPVEAR
jgi:hypothetical protein